MILKPRDLFYRLLRILRSEERMLSVLVCSAPTCRRFITRALSARNQSGGQLPSHAHPALAGVTNSIFKRKPFKRFPNSQCRQSTWLKPGVNERLSRQTPFVVRFSAILAASRPRCHICRVSFVTVMTDG